MICLHFRFEEDREYVYNIPIQMTAAAVKSPVAKEEVVEWSEMIQRRLSFPRNDLQVTNHNQMEKRREKEKQKRGS